MRTQILVVFIVSFFFLSVDTRRGCGRKKNCFACARQKFWGWTSCNWCPLTNQCHSKISLNNQCLKDQNIWDNDKCVRFEGRVKHYSPSEAYLLARFSAAAYSDVPNQCVGKLFSNKDYEFIRVIRKDCDDFYFEYDKQCLALVAMSNRRREIIVAIRGTRGGKQVLDQVLTVLTKDTVHFKTGGKVQAYFNNVLQKLYPTIREILTKLLRIHPYYEVKVTGHSLGGAVASLASALLVHENIVKSDKLFLYTFGMPRVGNKRYAMKFDTIVRNSWRIVRKGDVVTMLPKCFHGKCSLFNGPFHHGTKVLYTHSDMPVHSNYIICKGNEDSTHECEKRRRYKRGIVGNLMDKHREYFGMRIGTYCRDIFMNKINLL